MLGAGKWTGFNNFDKVTNMTSVVLVVDHANGFATNDLSVSGVTNHARNLNPAGLVHLVGSHNTGDNATGSHINGLNSLLGHSLLPLALSAGGLGWLAFCSLVALLSFGLRIFLGPLDAFFV